MTTKHAFAMFSNTHTFSGLVLRRGELLVSLVLVRSPLDRPKKTQVLHIHQKVLEYFDRSSRKFQKPGSYVLHEML
jgi:hypothetical protein